MAASGAIAAALAVSLADTAGWRTALAAWALPSDSMKCATTRPPRERQR
ncbi:hypothetical protein AB5J72_47285 [Streptomyces sp. CG1]